MVATGAGWRVGSSIEGKPNLRWKALFSSQPPSLIWTERGDGGGLNRGRSSFSGIATDAPVRESQICVAVLAGDLDATYAPSGEYVMVLVYDKGLSRVAMDAPVCASHIRTDCH